MEILIKITYFRIKKWIFRWKIPIFDSKSFYFVENLEFLIKNGCFRHVMIRNKRYNMVSYNEMMSDNVMWPNGWCQIFDFFQFRIELKSKASNIEWNKKSKIESFATWNYPNSRISEIPNHKNNLFPWPRVPKKFTKKSQKIRIGQF